MRQIVLAALLFTAISAAAAAKNPRDEISSLANIIDGVRSSVVLIEARFANGSSTMGSGFFVNDSGVVVTARHVTNPNGTVPQLIKVRLRIPTIEGPVSVVASWSAFPATEIGHDDAHDIEILKTAPNPFSVNPATLVKSYNGPGKTTSVTSPKPTAAKLDRRRLRDGEPVFASGYPLGLPILITDSGIIASSDPFTRELPAQQGQPALRSQVRDIYWADLRVNGGNSGGPLFSRVSGNVIGLIYGYDDAYVLFENSTEAGRGVTKLPDNSEQLRPLIYNSGIAIVVPARYIVELLQHLGLKYTSAEK